MSRLMNLPTYLKVMLVKRRQTLHDLDLVLTYKDYSLANMV